MSMSDEKSGKTEKGQASAPGAAPALPGSEPGRPGGIEQVRELLFGAIYRDLELHMNRTDTQVATRIHDLEQEFRKRMDVIETHLKKETESVAARMDRQLAELNDAVRSLGRDQRELAAQTERHIAKSEEATAAAQQELRHRLLEQAKSFLDELQTLRKDMLATFHQELGLEGGELYGERSEVEGGVRH
jgi:hypothetical protein